MKDVKKLSELFKKEKCLDNRLKIENDYIKTDYPIFIIPKSHKRDYCEFVYYLNDSRLSYCCWKENSKGNIFNQVSRDMLLDKDEYSEVSDEMYSYLKQSFKFNIKDKVIDIVCDMYLEKKLKELDDIENQT